MRKKRKRGWRTKGRVKRGTGKDGKGKGKGEVKIWARKFARMRVFPERWPWF